MFLCQFRHALINGLHQLETFLATVHAQFDKRPADVLHDRNSDLGFQFGFLNSVFISTNHARNRCLPRPALCLCGKLFFLELALSAAFAAMRW
jgi:hypothetical protein